MHATRLDDTVSLDFLKRCSDSLRRLIARGRPSAESVRSVLRDDPKLATQAPGERREAVESRLNRDAYERRDVLQMANVQQTRSHNVKSAGSMAAVDRYIERERRHMHIDDDRQRAIVTAARTGERQWVTAMVLAELRAEFDKRAAELVQAEEELAVAEIGDSQPRYEAASTYRSLMLIELWRCKRERLVPVATAVVLEIIDGGGWSDRKRCEAVTAAWGKLRYWMDPYQWALDRWGAVFRAGLDAERGIPADA